MGSRSEIDKGRGTPCPTPYNNIIDDTMSFGIAMMEKLKANRDKGYWEEIDIEWLLERLEEEMDELRKADLYTRYPQHTTKAEYFKALMGECVDVANFAMMIWVNARREQGEE